MSQRQPTKEEFLQTCKERGFSGLKAAEAWQAYCTQIRDLETSGDMLETHAYGSFG
jgi:hypothetical protein